MTSQPTSHDACRATDGESAGVLVASGPREQRADAAGVASMRGHAWLADSTGGVVEVPAGTSDDDVRELEALGCEVRRSAWARVATWTAGGAA